MRKAAGNTNTSKLRKSQRRRAGKGLSSDIESWLLFLPGEGSLCGVRGCGRRFKMHRIVAEVESNKGDVFSRGLYTLRRADYAERGGD